MHGRKAFRSFCGPSLNGEVRRRGRRRLRFGRSRPGRPVTRCERSRPGGMIHLNIKKLARVDGVGRRITGERNRRAREGVGWEFADIAIDDGSCLAFVQMKRMKKRVGAVASSRTQSPV